MKKFKNGRQVGYGAAGLAIGVIVYLTISISMPETLMVKSNRAEFLDTSYNNEESVVVDDDYTGDVIPLLPFGSYRVTQADFDAYEAAGVVTYGKINPTFYYEAKPAVVENEAGAAEGSKESAKSGESSSKKTIEEPTDKTSAKTTGSNETTDSKETTTSKESDKSTSNKGGREVRILDGFNIHTTETEKFDVSDIMSEFAESAVIPVDDKFFNVSSTFGIRSDPFSESKAFHAGVDFSQTDISGSNIYAVLDGEVVESVENHGKDGLGNYVVIDHGEFQTIYGHMLKKSELTKGSIIKAGDVVGKVGSTGRSTGPHLHFEVGVGGVKFDGLEFLDLIKTEVDLKEAE